MPSNVVENYLKTIFHLSCGAATKVNTNAIAEYLNVKSSTVTDMLKKLENMELVTYEKYQGAVLTEKGKQMAVRIIRKHRLWEVFLVEKLHFNWSEVHAVAEQLEHVDSIDLIDKLDAFLEYPKWDPHGDPIPDSKGFIMEREQIKLSEIKKGTQVVMLGVTQDNKSLLQYLDSIQLVLGSQLMVKDTFSFDHSIEIEIQGKKTHLSPKVAECVLVKVLTTA